LVEIKCEKEGCDKKATSVFCYLTKSNEYYFCDEHAIAFKTDMNDAGIDFMPTNLT
jgi:hypothetical protein